MSISSVIKFITLNGFLLLMSIIQYVICSQNNFILSLLSFLFKNIILVKSLTHAIDKYREKHSISFVPPVENYPHEFNIQLAKISFLEYVPYQMIKNVFKFSEFDKSELLYFIPVSFVFEIIFDFFHYWTHRIVHSMKTIYKATHKMHHRNIALIPISTFIQDPFDLAITNFFPNMMTLLIFNMLNINISTFIYMCITMYKSYIEIAGHCGIENTRSCSFPQFIWLPKMLGIELYSKNHHKHHTHLNVNFSKRFNLWDRVFGTWCP
jgi:sterol desaturase/sphingolipid hydroxylase (fatty acid hydroxylase superfamily)